MVFFLESLQNKRTQNEDSYCHMDIRMNHEAVVSAYAIADGMGGLDAGKKYSEEAVSLWFQELMKVLMSEQFKGCSLKSQIQCFKEFSGMIFQKINQILYENGMDAGTRGGTTLTTAIHFWDTWIIANCGDSPVYVLKDGKVSLESQIQNLAWEMIRENKTKIGSSLFYQNKNRLLQYLGRREEVRPFIKTMEDTMVDAILMGSDGAFGDICCEDMESIFQNKEESECLRSLLELARDHGESDNQTAFLIYPEKAKERMDTCSTQSMPQEEIGREVEEKNAVYRELEEESIGDLLLRRLTGRSKRRSPK